MEGDVGAVLGSASSNPVPLKADVLVQCQGTGRDFHRKEKSVKPFCSLGSVRGESFHSKLCAGGSR